MVFVKWNITTHDLANQNNFINSWLGFASSFVYEIILICLVIRCDISFHKNRFFRNSTLHFSMKLAQVLPLDLICSLFLDSVQEYTLLIQIIWSRERPLDSTERPFWWQSVCHIQAEFVSGIIILIYPKRCPKLHHHLDPLHVCVYFQMVFHWLFNFHTNCFIMRIV